MSARSVPVEDVEPSDVVQICMTGTTFVGVVSFLRSRGLTVAPFPSDEEDLPTFMVGISDQLWEASGAREKRTDGNG